MSYDISFHVKFRDALEKSGLSISDLGCRTGISQSQIRQYKTGGCSPRDNNRKKLALALGKPENYFMLPEKTKMNLAESSARLEHWRWPNGFP